ncbi:MAG: hypothetical protein E7196_02810 [Anaerovibrio lipolyticus]|nr:hypothetical protein [Anaerovibrio lipolyticus]
MYLKHEGILNDNLAKIIDVIFEQTVLNNTTKKLVSFTDIVDLMGGGTPDTTEREYWGGSVLFFTPKDITDSPFCMKTEKHLSELGLKNCSSRLYPRFTTFVTCRGTVGNISMAGEPMAMNQSCYAIKCKHDYSPFFTYAFSKYVIATMKRKASGAVFNALVTKDFEMEKIYLPDPNCIREFDRKVLPMFNAILSNTKEIVELSSMAQLLLKQLSH